MTLDPKALLPCPFCGKQPRSNWFGDHTPTGDDGYWGVECCHVHVHMDSEEEAITAWNTRSALPGLAGRLEVMARLMDSAGLHKLAEDARDCAAVLQGADGWRDLLLHGTRSMGPTPRHGETAFDYVVDIAFADRDKAQALFDFLESAAPTHETKE